MKKKTLTFAMPVLLFAIPLAGAADGDGQGCAAFTWDVSRELAVMSREAQPVDATATATVRVGEHHAVRLVPQAHLKFVLPPEREARSAAPRGAVLRFDAPTAGRYRVAITSRHWIDLIADGRIVASADHQGRAGCDLMHKVVEFDLPAASGLVLQLSGQDDEVIGLAIVGPH